MSPAVRIALTPKPAAALLTFGIIGYLGENLAPYFISAISSGLGVDTVAASSVTTVLFVATAVVGLSTGPIAAGRHRRTLARAGLAACTLGFAVAAIVPWLWVMYVAATVAGGGGGAIASTGGATLAAFRNPDRIAGLGGLVNSAVTAGVLAVIPLFGLWPISVFGPLAAVCLIALLVVTWMPKAPVDVESLPLEVATLESAVEDPKSGRRIIIAGLSLLVLFPIWGLVEDAVWAMASDLATRQVSMPQTDAGLVFSVGEIAALIGAGLLTIVGGRWGRALPLAVMLALSAALKVVMGVTTDALVWSTAFVVWDMVSAVAFLYFIAAAAGLDVKGRWSAPMTAAYMIGTALSPIAGASIVHAFGFRGFSWILAAAGFALVVPSIWLARISSQREHEQEAVAAAEAAAPVTC